MTQPISKIAWLTSLTSDMLVDCHREQGLSELGVTYDSTHVRHRLAHFTHL